MADGNTHFLPHTSHCFRSLSLCSLSVCTDRSWEPANFNCEFIIIQLRFFNSHILCSDGCSVIRKNRPSVLISVAAPLPLCYAYREQMELEPRIPACIYYYTRPSNTQSNMPACHSHANLVFCHHQMILHHVSSYASFPSFTWGGGGGTSGRGLDCIVAAFASIVDLLLKLGSEGFDPLV